MTETWPIRKQLARALPNGDYIRVTAGLHKLDGNERPYFSVTAELWYGGQGPQAWTGIRRFRQGLEAQSDGCMHEDILKAFPKLAPVVLVHLADDDGVPMHAIANGWYFYSGEARAWEEKAEERAGGPMYANPDNLSDHQRAAQALHIPWTVLPTDLNEQGFKLFAESLRPRWTEQAATAIEVLESL